MRLGLLLVLAGCAPVLGSVDPTDDPVPDDPVDSPYRWTGTWLATALDRILLSGERDEPDICVQLLLVQPGWEDERWDVVVSEPWGLENAWAHEGRCGEDPWGHEGVPLAAVEGQIAVTPDWPPERVDLDVRVRLDGEDELLTLQAVVPL